MDNVTPLTDDHAMFALPILDVPDMDPDELDEMLDRVSDGERL